MVEVRIGDVVTTDTTFFGSPITYRLTIKTQDAANYATELVNKPNASFKLERSAQETRDVPVATASNAGDGLDPGFYLRDGNLIMKD